MNPTWKGIGGYTPWQTKHLGSERDLWTPCSLDPRGRNIEFPFLGREQRGNIFYLEIGRRRWLIEVLASISPSRFGSILGPFRVVFFSPSESNS